MKIERTKNATRNMIFGTILKVYQIVLPFLMRSAMVYCLGVQYLGLNSLFTSVLQVLNLAELGVGSAMVYSMYKPIAEGDDTTICALINLYKWYYRLIGTVVLLCGLSITPFIPRLIKGDVPAELNVYILYLLNLGATVLTYWLFAYRNSVLQGYQRTDVVSKVTIITDTAKYLLQIGALFVFRNYYYYIIVILLTQILANISTAVAAKKLYPQYDARGKLPKQTVRKINGRIRDLFTAKLGSTIMNSADTIVISAFLGLTTLAVYQNYYFIMTSVVGIITVLLGSCTAGIGNSLVVETLDKNYNDFKKFALMLIWAVGICVCCFLNLYQPFMSLWMGEDNLLNMTSVILMCFYFYLYVTNHFMCTYKDAAGMWHEDRFRPLVASLSNLIMNLVMVRFIGIFAVILSTVLSYILVTMPWLIRNLFMVVFKRSCKEFVCKFIYYSFVVLIAALASYLVCLLVPERGVLAIVIRLIISVIASNVIFLLLLGKGNDYKSAVDMVDKLTKNKFVKITNKLRERA